MNGLLLYLISVAVQVGLMYSVLYVVFRTLTRVLPFDEVRGHFTGLAAWLVAAIYIAIVMAYGYTLEVLL